MTEYTIDWKPEKNKFTCTECGAGWRESQIPTTTSPAGQSWSYCSQCDSPECFVGSCDYPGCWEDADGGMPTTTIYVCTCRKHRPQITTPPEGGA